MSQLKSIEYNNDGTMDITDDTGVKFKGCYPVSKEPPVCVGEEVISVEFEVSYGVAERLRDWQKELDQHTTQLCEALNQAEKIKRKKKK